MKKNFTLLIAITTIAFRSHAQGTWTQKSDVGGTARLAGVGFSIGGKGYIGTGDSHGYGRKKDFWEYDPSTNAWTQKADFGGKERYMAVGFSIGSKGYIGTGLDGFGFYKNDFWEFDPVTNSWTQKADVGGSVRDLAVGFSIDSKGYIGTGNVGGTYFNDFWEYTPDTNFVQNNALNFDGANDFVSAKLPMNVVDNFTLETWIYPTLLSGIQVPLSYGFDNGFYGDGVSITLDGNGLQILFSGITFFSTGYTFPSVKQWYHIAFVRNNGKMHAYVNGNLAPNTANITPYIPTSFRIGSQNAIRFFHGKVDEVHIWNIARTQAEIQADMIGSINGNQNGLVAYFPFNQGIAGGDNSGVTRLDDITANNNDGTLNNFALTGVGSNWVEGVSNRGCSSPTNLSAKNITSTSAKLKWDSVPGGKAYKILYQVLNSGAWTQTRTSTNSKTITGLSEGTRYR